MRKQVPPEKTKDVLDFATKRPAARLASIINGLGVSAVPKSFVKPQLMCASDRYSPMDSPNTFGNLGCRSMNRVPCQSTQGS